MKRARPDDNISLSAAKKRKINPASSTSNKFSFHVPSLIDSEKENNEGPEAMHFTKYFVIYYTQFLIH